jgi:hypothetical protein
VNLQGHVHKCKKNEEKISKRMNELNCFFPFERKKKIPRRESRECDKGKSHLELFLCLSLEKKQKHLSSRVMEMK